MIIISRKKEKKQKNCIIHDRRAVSLSFYDAIIDLSEKYKKMWTVK